MSDLINAADLLDVTRRRAGLRQADLAKRIGLSQQHVSKLLTGRERITAPVAAKLQRALGHRDLAERLLVAQARADALAAVTALEEQVDAADDLEA